MKAEEKSQTPFLMSSNPFLTKPLKKVNNSNLSSSNPPQSLPQKEIHKINEHRASKFVNIPNIKNIKHSIIDKKPPEPQKNTHYILINEQIKKNSDNNINQTENKISKKNDEAGFKNILKKFGSQEKNMIKEEKNEENKVHRKRASIEKYINPKIEENFKKENEIVTKKNYNTNNSDPGEEKNDNKENQQIQVSIKENPFKLGDNNKKENNYNKKGKENSEYINKEKIINDDNFRSIPIKKENLISFKNEDEILEYIKNKIKEGKIKNIYQKLELKNYDFSGFSISKKNQGYTIYEIKVEEDITKINEILKKQKIEIKNKPVQFVYTEELESLIKIKKEYTCLKEITFTNIKNDFEKSTGTTIKPKDKPINKIIENKFPKNEKSNEIKNNKNTNSYNISVEGSFKSKKIESEIKEKMIPEFEKKPVDENKFAGVGVIPEINDKKAKEIQNQKRVSKAYNRFKKAFSLHKDKENEKNTGNSDKIHIMASILQEHIMKPLNEIQEENEREGKIYRDRSVECRQAKIDDNNLIDILENAPVIKKNVKKPKLNNFVNN